jgi:hypothetical protein
MKFGRDLNAKDTSVGDGGRVRPPRKSSDDARAPEIELLSGTMSYQTSWNSTGKGIVLPVKE